MKMNSNKANERRERVKQDGVLKSCKGLLAQVSRTKAAILGEARETLAVQEQLLRLALNEAEALAWQTLYPHLVFPALAAEKIQGMVARGRFRSLIFY
jgi:hypothetical protein